MNKDLLIKLTKLANHNPNDHEANSAARRVCKMLEEAHFNLTDTAPPKQQQYKATYYESVENDIFRWFYKMYTDPPKSSYSGGTWNDVHRSTEPEFRSKPPNYHDIPYNPFTEKKPKEKRNLKCKTCGKKRETVFVGAEELFECNNCQWTAYTRKKAESR